MRSTLLRITFVLVARTRIFVRETFITRIFHQLFYFLASRQYLFNPWPLAEYKIEMHNAKIPRFYVGVVLFYSGFSHDESGIERWIKCNSVETIGFDFESENVTESLIAPTPYLPPSSAGRVRWTRRRTPQTATLFFADKTIRLLFPGTLSINGNVYCSPKGRGEFVDGEVTVPLVRSILHDTRALLRFREFFGH